MTALIRTRPWAVLLALVACGTGPPDGAPGTAAPATGPATAAVTTAVTTSTPPPPVAGPRTEPDREGLAAADAALDRRVAAAGLAGGAVVVVRAGTEIHAHTTGPVDRSTPLATASSAKWLTAATVLTFVDEGRLGLEDPVGRWLPELAATDRPVTVRHLLVHTSGLRDQACLWDAGFRLADCVARVAAGPRQFAPGAGFSYGNAGYHVLGRLVEVLGGADFATVFARRLGDPLGLTATTWPGAPNNPSPAAGARTTVDDYLRFLALLAGGGATGGRRLLSVAAVGELTRNQITGYDTAGDEAVGITGIGRYALGAWPDEVDGTGATVVVSGNGGRGFYPWLDVGSGTWGVVGVQDDRGAPRAVPASQEVARRYWRAARGG